jgi:hypothetical protein
VRNDELSYNLGEVVDRLISVQYFMSGGGSALTRKPVTGVLYEAAREKAGAPLRVCEKNSRSPFDELRASPECIEGTNGYVREFPSTLSRSW